MITATSMPKIDVSAIELSASELEIVGRILNKGCLRASKPKIDYTIVTNDRGQRLREPDAIGGRAAYVWRMVAFIVSPIGKHHCMPCTAEFDLPGSYAERRELVKELDALASKVTDCVRKSEWHGARRWSQAMYGR